jgi:D-inositol-3-phosphate glycosyltransferase
MSKKIFILSPAYPLRGGIASFSERLAREFQAEGHQVTIVSFSLQYPSFLFPGKTQFSSDPPPSDLQIETCINSINPFNWLKIGIQLARQRPDVVIARFWLPFMGMSLGTILWLLKILRGGKKMKIMGLVDNIIPHEKRFGDRLLARYFATACDGFVVMSRSVGEELKQFSNRKSVFIPHPIYDNYGKKVSRTEGVKFLQLDANQRFILFFGFIRRYKGLDLLLDAMGLMKLKYPPSVFRTEDLGLRTENAHQASDSILNPQSPILIVAGEFYEDEQFFRQKIKDLQLENDVIVHADFIPSENVRYYFAAADLVVQPYRTATQSGISQVAYHFEKPMLVTNVGGLSEIVPHGEVGYVVEPQAEAIATALQDFYEHNRLETFIEKVIKNKKRFAWSAMTNAFLEF